MEPHSNLSAGCRESRRRCPNGMREDTEDMTILAEVFIMLGVLQGHFLNQVLQ
jgi:hypothetical protein